MTNLYALIVGIEKYDLPGWNRSGPVAGAIEMAYWCNSIGMPFKNLYMFLSINDQDPMWVSGHRSTISHFRKTGATIIEDTTLNAVDTFWRNTLPTLLNGDSKLLLYWCGHGVTRSDRDRILLHTDFLPDNLSNRVTSADTLVASLTTQTYRRFKEQLIVADVCGDFSSYSVSPNTHPPIKPVDSITQHCYFATVDGQSTQIQNGIGQFTQSTLEVLKQYSDWPDLDELKERMDKKFRNGSLKPFKISIQTPLAKYEISNNISANANDASLQSSSEDIEQLISTCNAHIKKNELDELFQLLDDFLANAKSKAFDEARNSLQILQSDLNNFQMGELNGTLTPDPDTQRRILITKIQKLLKLIESKVGKGTNRSSSLKMPASANSVLGKMPSSKNKISIPSPDKDAITVTPDSEISSSPPSVPPKNPLEFFRQQISKLLDGNEEMTSVLAHAIVSKNENSDKDHVIEYLIGNTVSTNEFPLRRFKRILEELVGKRIELKRDSFQTLTLLTEILEIASYPVEDCQRIEEAMQEILSSNTGNPAIGGLSTSKIEDAKKLLIATRLKLLGAEFSDLNVAQLLNKNMLDNSDVRLLMRKIHVVTEPTLKSDDLTLIEFYSKACIDDLNYAQSSSSYQDDLQDVLEEKSKVGAVVSLLLSNEKTEAIKQLRNRFPLLLVVGLPKESISLYKAIVRDLKDIDECLTDLCGNVKRVT